MKGWLSLAGGLIGVGRRGFSGALLGVGLGYIVGAVIEAIDRLERNEERPEHSEPEGHYLRYPEEAVIDAMLETGPEPTGEGQLD